MIIALISVELIVLVFSVVLSVYLLHRPTTMMPPNNVDLGSFPETVYEAVIRLTAETGMGWDRMRWDVESSFTKWDKIFK